MVSQHGTLFRFIQAGVDPISQVILSATEKHVFRRCETPVPCLCACWWKRQPQVQGSAGMCGFTNHLQSLSRCDTNTQYPRIRRYAQAAALPTLLTENTSVAAKTCVPLCTVTAHNRDRTGRYSTQLPQQHPRGKEVDNFTI